MKVNIVLISALLSCIFYECNCQTLLVDYTWDKWVRNEKEEKGLDFKDAFSVQFSDYTHETEALAIYIFAITIGDGTASAGAIHNEKDDTWKAVYRITKTASVSEHQKGLESLEKYFFNEKCLKEVVIENGNRNVVIKAETGDTTIDKDTLIIKPKA